MGTQNAWNGSGSATTAAFEVDLEKEADLASAVSLLRLFLQELPEPVIPAGLQAQIMQLYQGGWRFHAALFSYPTSCPNWLKGIIHPKYKCPHDLLTLKPS